MSVKEIRRKNLLKLLERFESKKAFAEETSLAPGHVSQMANGYREMGDSVARRIEQKLNLARGWMDLPHDDVSEEALAIAKAIDREADPERIKAIYKLLGLDKVEVEHRQAQRRQRNEPVPNDRREKPGRRKADKEEVEKQRKALKRMEGVNITELDFGPTLPLPKRSEVKSDD